MKNFRKKTALLDRNVERCAYTFRYYWCGPGEIRTRSLNASNASLYPLSHGPTRLIKQGQSCALFEEDRPYIITSPLLLGRKNACPSLCPFPNVQLGAGFTFDSDVIHTPVASGFQVICGIHELSPYSEAA